MVSTSTSAPGSATTSERIAALTDDGVRLALRRVRPAGASRAVCLLTHAMMARGSYLGGPGRGLAGSLAAAGIDCFVLDWRGHGDSVPPSPRDRPGWCFDDYVDRDLPAAVSAAAAAARIAPGELCYLGHSLGGLVGLAGTALGRIAAPRRMALLSTSVWLPGPGGSRRRRAAMAAMALLSRPLGYLPVRRLGFGSDDEPRSYVEQLAGWALSGRWTGRSGVDYLARLGDIDTPVLPISGEGDRLCRPRDAEVLALRLRRARPLRRVGRRHGDALDADHFTLFTRAELAPLWAELAGFFTAP